VKDVAISANEEELKRNRGNNGGIVLIDDADSEVEIIVETT
jgi:hypothetical protein